jgi:glycogen phosphorylase
MKPVRTFNVVPALPQPIAALRETAYNLQWSWSHDCIALFRRLDADLWETSGHNPVLMLGRIDQEKLEAAARDDAFLAHLQRVLANLDSYLRDDTSWFKRLSRDGSDKPVVAYFSAEFGLTECLSIFAGGLGMLAGDHLKSASDLGVPLTGVGLLYQQGYFRQYLNQGGWQQESYENNDFHTLPINVVEGDDGQPLTIQVEFPGRAIFAQVWRAQVGRIPLYLLDTNISSNRRSEDRSITEQLYGGDRETRIQQEILLGIGGYRALEALGLKPTVYHMNEGHSAFLAVELIRHLIESRQLTFAEARELASASLVFTTHTPVEAGHDYFSPEQMDRYFGDYARQLGLSREDFLALGRTRPHDHGEFCMTVLALRLSSHSNGVSKLHGEVSRKMWAALWPGTPTDEIPIRHITNGVHFRSWTSEEMNQLYDRYLGPSWREEPANHDVWNRVDTIPAEVLWRTHERRRERLVAWARQRVRYQRIRRSASQSEIEAAEQVLDPEVLTIGFARRFATYKRATLILRDLPRLKRILTDVRCPVQLIFAGKAHPRDDAGKELIQQITRLSREPELGRRLVFIEDYDMAVARYLVQGVDVWLNTPLRPNEASGTSGMKAAANGVLNLSTLDGWWDEVWRARESESATLEWWRPSSRATAIGWAVGRGETYEDAGYQDQVEAEALFDVLERDVIPAFYDRGQDRIPRKWIEAMKASIAVVCPFVNTHRMVRDYTCQFYLEAHRLYRNLEADGAARARQLAAWAVRIRQSWPQVRVETVEQGPETTLPVGTEIRVQAQVRLGELSPRDVSVETYVGLVNPTGDIVEATSKPMEPVTQDSSGLWSFETTAPCGRSGMHGLTVRLRPKHPDLADAFLHGFMSWAEIEQSRSASA